MKDYYLLIGLNSKEIKILNVRQNTKGVIESEIENRKNKIRCIYCNKFISSVHDKLKPVRSVYLNACGSNVDLKIYKKQYHCYNCNIIFNKSININNDNILKEGKILRKTYFKN